MGFRIGGRRALIVVLALVVVGAIAGSAVYLLGIGDDGDNTAATRSGSTASATPSPTPQPTPRPVLGGDSTAAPPPSVAGLAAALRTPLADHRLGGSIEARVVDVLTGQVLLDQDGAQPATPASTTKLLTAVATLATVPADFRFTTTVVAGAQPGEVVLVGGGDPTLAAQSAHPAYPGAASVDELARSVLARMNTPITRVVVDGSRFSGAGAGPGWDSDDVTGGYVAPITAAMVDGGRLHPGNTARSSAPDLSAGTALAAALHAPHAGVVRGTAPAHARTLGVVRSAPLTTIVAQTLTESDNTLAEFLARQVAVQTGQPASFAGAAAAVKAKLVALGVPAAGIDLHDDSGLSRDNRISPAALTQTLRIAASPQHPELHALFAGMPVGGYAGTLAGRYHDAGSQAGAGYVRAKTGTLSSVSSLAGVVQDRSGRLLAFALMADKVSDTGTLDAEDALDAIAAQLAGCGCR